MTHIYPNNTKRKYVHEPGFTIFTNLLLDFISLILYIYIYIKLIGANNPVSNETKKIIEQNNFVNNSLHIIGQQLDRIEKKVEKPTS